MLLSQITFLFFVFPLISSIEIDLQLQMVPKSLTVSTKYYADNDFYYFIPICLGTPLQCMNVLYETNFTHLIINPIPSEQSHHFVMESSTSVTDLKKTVSPSELYGDAINDKLLISIYQFNFDFIHGHPSSTRFQSFDGVFGFGNEYDTLDKVYNNSFSVIKMLKEEGRIKNRLFGHKYFDDRRFIRLYIGEITDNTFIEKFGDGKGYPKCDMKKSKKALKDINKHLEHLWSCSLNEITILTESPIEIDNSEGYVIFSTGSNTISGPLSQGEIIIKEILKDSQLSEKCKEIYFNGGKLNLICAWSLDLYSFPKIQFSFSGVNLILDPTNLFYKEYDIKGENFVFKARFEFGSEYKYWTFGQPILRNYDMIFDMDDNSVGFWNAESVPISKKTFLKSLGTIVIIVIILSIIVGAIIFYLKWKKEHSPEYQRQKRLYSKIEKLQDIEMSQ